MELTIKLIFNGDWEYDYKDILPQLIAKAAILSLADGVDFEIVDFKSEARDCMVRCASCEDVHKKIDRKRNSVLGLGNSQLDTFNCPKCGSGIVYDLLK